LLPQLNVSTPKTDGGSDQGTYGWVRELLTSPKRHTDPRAELPRIATRVLGDRLQLLQQAGLVRLATLPPAGRLDRVRVHRPRPPAQAGAVGPGWLGIPLLGSLREQDAYRLSWLVLALEQRFDPRSPEASS
jgi:hypothetical protein